MLRLHGDCSSAMHGKGLFSFSGFSTGEKLKCRLSVISRCGQWMACRHLRAVHDSSHIDQGLDAHLLISGRLQTTHPSVNAPGIPNTQYGRHFILLSVSCISAVLADAAL